MIWKIVIAVSLTIGLGLACTGIALADDKPEIMTDGGDELGKNLTKDASTGEEINWQVISSGGEDNGTSTNYGLAGTVSQTAVGAGGSTDYGLIHGFWQNFSEAPGYICGDADGSGNVDIDDVVHLIAYIFSGGPEPVPLESGDADCSGGIDIDDVVYLIAYIFSGGTVPCDTDADGEPDC